MSEKPSPCVRVELRYEDGSIERLTGEAAEQWLQKMNGLVGLHYVRYGVSPMPEFPWERSDCDNP